jgi:hypothetical protein
MLPAQLLELLDAAAVEQLADLPGGALADAVDLLQAGGVERGDVAGVGLDRPQRALVRAHAERLHVALVERGELGQLAQHVEHVTLAIGHREQCRSRENG